MDRLKADVGDLGAAEAVRDDAATVIAEKIGWERSIAVLREKVAQLRPLHLPTDPAGWTAYEPGGRVQDDFWFPPAEIPLGHGKVATGGDVPAVLGSAGQRTRPVT